jgi:hypothetical protein
MKKIFYILSFSLLFSYAASAQDEGADKIRERMTEYIQKRLKLTKSEADRFSPVFLNYFNELRQTNQQFRADRLVLQQKIADLRVRYRDQFKNIIGDKRSNQVFVYEKQFVDEVKRMREEKLQNHKQRPINKNLRGQLQ